MVNVEQGSLTALVVDDDRAIRDLLDDVLSEAGFSTMCFAYGQPALEAITQRRYDLLVLDIGLPDMNGMRICVEARDLYGGQVAILIITADDRTERCVATLELGADDFLGKPFHIDELLTRISVKLRRTLGVDAY